MNFKTYLFNEAFNFRPTSIKEISKLKNAKELQDLFDLLQTHFPHVKEPLAIDIDKGTAKIVKDLEVDIGLMKLKATVLNNKAFSAFGNGSSNKNRRSMMSQIEDFGEIATIDSLTKKMEVPEDSGQQFFIEDPAAFKDWQNTFKQTKLAIQSFAKNSLDQYDFLHDARDKSSFNKVIKRFLKKSKMGKHNWSPADTFMILKSDFGKIVKELNYIVDSYDGNNLITIFNAKFFDYYNDGSLYSISLKKIDGSYKTEFSNIPKENVDFNELKIERFICNFKLDTKEIGTFRFKHKKGTSVVIQHNQQPPGFSTTQTEIVNDGSASAGKVGKVPTFFVSNIMEEYGESRIERMTYFGTKRNKLQNFDSQKRKKAIAQYKVVSKYRGVETSLSYSEFKDLVMNAENLNDQELNNFVSKIQGLNMQYFFISNKDQITEIINRMILAAKKIGPNNPFFIKVY